MSAPTRRGFLALAGTGAAAVGLAGVAPAVAVAEVKTAHVPDASGPLVAYLADMAHDEVRLLVGEREVTVHDRDLAARLARAAHSS